MNGTKLFGNADAFSLSNIAVLSFVHFLDDGCVLNATIASSSDSPLVAVVVIESSVTANREWLIR